MWQSPTPAEFDSSVVFYQPFAMLKDSQTRLPGREQDGFGEMIPFVDLKAQRARLGPGLESAIARVFDHGAFIMGPEVTQLEQRLAAFCGARHAIACSSGTDAILLALLSLDVKPGDAVLVPAFAFVATAEVVARLGATPIFLDVKRDSFNLNPDFLSDGVASAESLGCRPVGVIAVDLFGQPAEYDQIERRAAELGLWLVCDAAQSFGAVYRGRRVGTIGRITTTSFYPAKPLGCYGDGGALFTDDDSLAETIRSTLLHGTNKDKSEHLRIGLNGRLDTLQAAILLEKLAIFEDEIESRNTAAAAYTEGIADLNSLTSPVVSGDVISTWSQYTLQLEGIDRAEFRSRLAGLGIPTAIYYSRPLPLQPAYRNYPVAGDDISISEGLSASVVSLPIHAYLDQEIQSRIIAGIHQAAT